MYTYNMETEYLTTRQNYNDGATWHEEKSAAYNWSEQINTFLDNSDTRIILDAGCGAGRDVREFIARGLEVTGIDFSQTAIEKLQINFPNNKFYVFDLLHIDLEDNSFDAIWVCASILNLKKQDVVFALREFRRLLKQEGGLFISVKEGVGERMVADKISERFFSFFEQHELQDILEREGFVVKKVERMKDIYLTGSAGGENSLCWLCFYSRKL